MTRIYTAWIVKSRRYMPDARMTSFQKIVRTFGILRADLRFAVFELLLTYYSCSVLTKGQIDPESSIGCCGRRSPFHG